MVMAWGVEIAVTGGGGTLVGVVTGVALANTKEEMSVVGVVVVAQACVSMMPPPFRNRMSAAAVAAPTDPAPTLSPNKRGAVLVLLSISLLINTVDGRQPFNQEIIAIKIDSPADNKQNGHD